MYPRQPETSWLGSRTSARPTILSGPRLRAGGADNRILLAAVNGEMVAQKP